MVQLLESDILTKEVLDWTGVHLLHFEGSSCSQKARVFMNLKGIEWESHPINLGTGENYSEYYLGINPRGLVPTLVQDGEVHIESMTSSFCSMIGFQKTNSFRTGWRTRWPNFSAMRMICIWILGLSPFVSHSHEVKSHDLGILCKITEIEVLAGLEVKRMRKDVELKFWETAATVGITDDAVHASAARQRYIEWSANQLERTGYFW